MVSNLRFLNYDIEFKSPIMNPITNPFSLNVKSIKYISLPYLPIMTSGELHGRRNSWYHEQEEEHP